MVKECRAGSSISFLIIASTGNMEFISSIGKFHESSENYKISDTLETIRQRGHKTVYLALIPGLWQESVETEGISAAATGIGLEVRDLFLQEERDAYTEGKAFLNKSENLDPNLKVKVKLLEMVDATIYSYMKGIWRDYSSVNSELTDSVFRAKHLLMSAVVPSFEANVWTSLHERMKEKLLSSELLDLAVIVNVESRYWFVDNMF